MTHWWDNDHQQIAFCVEGKGFIAFNDQYNTDMDVTLKVNMENNRRFNPEFPEIILCLL
jgi:hypothetical protein